MNLSIWTERESNSEPGNLEKPKSVEEKANATLVECRTEIDRLDIKLIELLSRRAEYVKAIRRLRIDLWESNTYDYKRKDEAIKNIKIEAENKCLNNDFVSNFWREILQDELMSIKLIKSEKVLGVDNDSIPVEILFRTYKDWLDSLDRELIEFLSQRMICVKNIWEAKKELKVGNPLDNNRWLEVLKNIKKKALSTGLDKCLIEKLWNIIHTEALRIENNIWQNKK